MDRPGGAPLPKSHGYAYATGKYIMEGKRPCSIKENIAKFLIKPQVCLQVYLMILKV